MRQQSHYDAKGIIQYWPQILSMLMLVGTGGVFYGNVNNAFIEIKNGKERQDRQFELYQKLEQRIIDIEKRTEYYRGLREGRTEKTTSNGN